MQVEIVLKEGPVEILSQSGAGVDDAHDLWGGIGASEFFPANTKSAFYRLTLRKEVGDPNGVLETEQELVRALQLLAASWPFAGGSFMILESRDVITSPRFESNAATVRAQLLSQVGKSAVTSSTRIAYETVAGYRQPPLRTASGIAKAAIHDHGLGGL